MDMGFVQLPISIDLDPQKWGPNSHIHRPMDTNP